MTIAQRLDNFDLEMYRHRTAEPLLRRELRPFIQIVKDINSQGFLTTVAVDGTTIAGDGTTSNPLRAIGSSSLITAVANTSSIGLTVSEGTLTASFINGAAYITASSTDTLTNKSGNISQWTNDSGYITGVTSGNLTEATSSILTITGGAGAVLGSGTTIQVSQASGAQSGYLSAADWTTFNNKGSGSVTSVSVVTNQGVSGSVATATTTPAITLSLGDLTGVTSFNGLVVTANTGVITTGTWSATAIAADRGGTGITSYAVGDLLYASGATTLSKLAAVADGQVLISDGVTTAPTWSSTIKNSSGNTVLDIPTTAFGAVGWGDQTRLIINDTDNTAVLKDNVSSDAGFWFYGANSTGATFSEVGIVVDKFSEIYLIGNLAADYIAVQIGSGTFLSSGTTVTIGTTSVALIIDEGSLKTSFSGGLINMSLTNYASDAAAGAAGLTTGDLYRTAGAVMIKL